MLTWPAGNGWLVGKLHEKIRAKLRLGLAVADVAPVRTGGRRRDRDRQAARRGRASTRERVIFAAPQFVARARGPAVSRRAAAASRRVRVRRVDGREHHARRRARSRARAASTRWRGTTSSATAHRSATSSRRIRRGRDHGPTVLTYYHPLCDEDPRAARTRLYAAGRDEWADVALADLETRAPDIRELATRVDVVRWGHAMVRPLAGRSCSAARARRAARPFAASTSRTPISSGVALFEEAFHHGVPRAPTRSLAALRCAREARGCLSAADRSRACFLAWTSRSSRLRARASARSTLRRLHDETPEWAWIAGVHPRATSRTSGRPSFVVRTSIPSSGGAGPLLYALAPARVLRRERRALRAAASSRSGARSRTSRSSTSSASSTAG